MSPSIAFDMGGCLKEKPSISPFPLWNLWWQGADSNREVCIERIHSSRSSRLFPA